MGRMTIYTSLKPNPPRSNGTGDDIRVMVDQVVHNGPTGTIGRTARLVMEKGEALELAIELLGQLPLLWLADAEQHKERVKLERLLNMAKVNDI